MTRRDELPRARFPLAAGLLLLWLVSCAAAAPAGAGRAGEVVYEVHLDAPQTQHVEVVMEFPARGDHEVVSLPVWRPGRYSVLDPVGTLRTFRAESRDGRALGFEKVDKTSWRIDTTGAERVRVLYSIYANSIEDRTRHVDATHAFLSGSSVFLFSERLRSAPVEVRVSMPADWKVACGLEPVGGDPRVLAAASYDVLVDSPLELGLHDVLTFEHEGVPHEVVIWPPGVDYDAEHLVEDLEKVVASQVALYGRMPYSRYVFLIHAGAGGGGTEHLNSTIMQTRRSALEGSHERDDSYRGFLGLASHEYYHTYNVKQLRPAGIHPYDYLRENYTDLLWVSEGTTSYYGPLTLAQAGLVKEKKYLDDLARSIGRLRRLPGARVQSLAESSFDAWTKFNVRSDDDVNAEVSFYEKGALVSFLLDLELRRRTEGRVGLDAVMRTMFERFPLSGSGFTTADLVACLDELSGTGFGPFFASYVAGLDPLPFEDAVGAVGLELAFEPTKKEGDEADEDPADEDDDDEAPTLKPYLGLDLRDGGGGAVVRAVRSDGPAYGAGVLVGDEIVALDKRRLRAGDLDSRLERRAPGETVRLHLLRRDELLELDVTLAGIPDGSWKLTRVEEPSELQRASYAAWIGQPWPGDGEEDASAPEESPEDAEEED